MDNVVVRTLKSLKLTLVLLGVFAVAIAVATFIEADLGTKAAQALVYKAKWFEFVLALLIINLVMSLVFNMPYPKRQTGYVITHFGFIVVLLAAGVTRYFGYEGTMPIREGSATNFIYSAEDHLKLGVDGSLETSELQLWRAGPFQ